MSGLSDTSYTFIYRIVQDYFLKHFGIYILNIFWYFMLSLLLLDGFNAKTIFLYSLLSEKYDLKGTFYFFAILISAFASDTVTGEISRTNSTCKK